MLKCVPIMTGPKSDLSVYFRYPQTFVSFRYIRGISFILPSMGKYDLRNARRVHLVLGQPPHRIGSGSIRGQFM